jgi:cytochrome b
MELQEVLDDVPADQAVEDHAPTTRIRLWDLPVRIFHWSLLAAVATAIVTGKLGGDWMGLHGKAGLSIIGLVAFRLAWGFFGSTHARFVSFLPSPAKLLAYLKGRWKGVGHNPLGALSVLALLGVLGVQAGTGLFSNDDIAFTGPLATLVDEAFSHRLTSLHHQLVNALFVLLGLHVIAIAYYVWIKKNNLLKPMVTGWKDVDAQTKTPRQAGPVALIVSVAIALATVYAVSGAWIHEQAPAQAPANSKGNSTSKPAAW